MEPAEACISSEPPDWPWAGGLIVRPSRRNAARCSGYSLVEMLVVIAAMSVVLGVTVVTLETLYRAQLTQRRDLHWAQTRDRLALRFRIDAHAALAAEQPAPDLKEKADILRFRFADQRTIEYRSEAGQIIRLQRRGDKIEHRDTRFVFPVSWLPRGAWNR